MEKDLLDFTQVPFDRLYFDPNNPRLAPDDPPGYHDPDKIFGEAIQRALFQKIPEVYKPDALRDAIESQGWVPIDAIVVWEHPEKKGHYVVLEGNTRTYVLRSIRQDLEKARAKLKKLEGARAGVSKEDIKQQKALVARLEQIIKDTEKVTVAPVNAKTIEQLLHRLPRLLGVRHIQPAKQWSPYAKNLYISSLYEHEFKQKFPKLELSLDDELIKLVASRVSEKPLETRRSIQAAHAFTHFKVEYEDQLPKGKGESFKDEDQYFFDQILRNRYAKDQFKFGDNDLRLSAEMEQALFKWAFTKPRGGKENLNVLEIAEDIRLWHQMSLYDDKKATSFAKQLDVSDPESAPRIREIEADYQYHRQRASGVDLFGKLLKEMSELKAEALKEQSSHYKPILEQVSTMAASFLKMIEAVKK